MIFRILHLLRRRSFCGILTIFTIITVVPPSMFAQPLSDGIAAIVNSEVITLSELEHELKDETVRLKAKYSGKILRQKLIQKEYAVLNRLIERKLQLQEAKARGLTVTDEEFHRAMDQFRGSGIIDPAIEKAPERILREELLIRKVLDFEVRRNLMVSPSELLAYYESSKDQFRKPAEYHIRQILLVPQPGEAEHSLQDRATELINKIHAGQPFHEVATRHSVGPESVRGGDLGFVRKDELLEPLGNMLDQLKTGEVSPPIHSPIGMHIFMIEEIKPGDLHSFEEVQGAIQSRLLQRKTLEAQNQWLSSLKDKAYIEIKL